MYGLETSIKQCQFCNLRDIDIKKGRQVPVGWGKGKIMVIGLAPSDSRQDSFYAMKAVSEGDTANILNDVMKAVGLKEEDFYITNLVKCSFPSNECDEKYFDICYNRWLLKEIIRCSPTKIICLGDAVYKYISSKSYLTSIFDIRKVWHHSYLSRNRSEEKEKEWEEQWRKIISD